MRHTGTLTPQFFVTAPQPCPYLAGRQERKLFTALYGDNSVALNDTLSRKGFRRSQNVLYRPSCADCAACLSARLPVADFRPSRSQARVLKRNSDIVRRSNAPWATEEQFELFRAYLDARHADGGMAEMDEIEFAAMIEESPVRTRVVEYRLPEENDRLIAVCLTDLLADGVSMVYSFFDTALEKRSLGAFMILDHIRIAGDAQLPFVYLGYWVPGSPKMAYKARYRPFEIYQGGRWLRVDRPDAVRTDEHPLSSTPILEQVAEITSRELMDDR
ncbi:arginyltransferase [Paroceanicella profunda]|uniref:Aspartate/glutamate leucyltransferase n=1 Tax=Paroceanicella profunda TaxID=2579971 RepID=A0A5B8G1A9_9RHOB|nr:arginyltransferase [Paroceanicella profunda]QDL92852.1 arginyltransferase [Paroceanicella profunda]